MNTEASTAPPAAKLSSPWIFFAATFAWTWSFWMAAALLRVGLESTAGFILLLLGVLGPMVMGITFTHLTHDREGRKDFYRRIIDARRIGARWCLVILVLPPALVGLAALIDLLTGGSGATWGEAAHNFVTSPLSILPSILFATLIPFIEELGWRGYVLDRLQGKWSALISTLILGSVWSLWHLPLFFIEGSYQAGLGVGTLQFWSFMIGILFLSFAFTWVYNNTGRSILAVILFHAMVNFSGELVGLSVRADAISIVLWAAVAVGIVAIWGPQRFSRKRLPAA